MKFKVQCLLLLEGHCVKSAHIQSYQGLHFPAFGLNLIYSVRMWENTDQNISEYGHFLRSKCGLVFYSSLSLVIKYHNKKCPLAKFKQFSKCGFGEISSQHLTTSPCIRK